MKFQKHFEITALLFYENDSCMFCFPYNTHS